MTDKDKEQIQGLFPLFEKYGLTQEDLDVCMRYVDVCNYFDELDGIDPDRLNYVRLMMWAEMTSEQRLRVVKMLEKEKDGRSN